MNAENCKKKKKKKNDINMKTKIVLTWIFKWIPLN